MPPYGSYADKRDLLPQRSTDRMALGICPPLPPTSNTANPLHKLHA